MIFVTVGSALPFDRLIQAMDAWAAGHPQTEVFAQIGAGAYVPQHMGYERMITPAEFRRRSESANTIVAHAGMGSVITASELGKPIVLLPRLASAREHTTDHQLHTAGWLTARPGIFVASSEADLAKQIAAAQQMARSSKTLSKFAPAAFTDKLRTALLG